MTQAGGGNIIGAMIQADEIYTFYGTRLILYVRARFYADMHFVPLLYSTTFCFLLYNPPPSQEGLTSRS